MPIESMNPANGEVIERFEELDDTGIEKALVMPGARPPAVSGGERCQLLTQREDFEVE